MKESKRPNPPIAGRNGAPHGRRHDVHRTANHKAAAPPGTQSVKGNGAHDRVAPHHERPICTRSDSSDESVLQDYRNGDRASFATLVNRYHRELYHFLVRFLGNRASAEDIFQETFMQVHQSAEQFDMQRRFRPWLFTIAANKARDLIRAQSRRPTNPLQASISPGDDESGEFIDLMQSVSELPSDPMEKREMQQLVHDTIRQMPENLREILLLSYFHQFPYKQIGEILDIPLGTVKSRLHAAVAHFANCWRQANPQRYAS